MPGNAAERARWAKQRDGVGVAVEKIEEQRRQVPEGFFGHRKRGCEATSSPSAPAKTIPAASAAGMVFVRVKKLTPRHA